MHSIMRQVKTTIGYGLATGALSLGTFLLLNGMAPRSLLQGVVLWAGVAGYAALLCRWSEKGRTAPLYPLLLGIAPVLGNVDPSLTTLMVVGCLAWIRSGICFPETGRRGVVLEGILCFGGLWVSGLLATSSALEFSAGLWTFFLVQAIYFVLHRPRTKDAPGPDAFRQIKAEAERLLRFG